MSTTKFAILGALGLATVAIAHGTADATFINNTEVWCKTKSTVDQTIISSASAVLVFKSDGDVVLEPLNKVASKIWSAGKAGQGEKLCFESDGKLNLYNAAGASIWNLPGSATSVSSTTMSSLWSYDVTDANLVLNDCTLAATYTAEDIAINIGDVDKTSGTFWSKTGTCPTDVGTAISNTVDGVDGWCMDTTEAGVIIESAWSNLNWQSDGNLVLYATGIDAGTAIYASGTQNLGSKLCFENTGRLAI